MNFQKHSDLQLDFVNGVNVIHGASEVGKSCIKHAIEFLTQHDTFKGQRKVGTKTTSVEAELSNGIIIKRIISNSINRYILTKDGKEDTFDSVGKNAPEEIKKAIGIYPISIDGEEIYLNSQSQIGLPFLFDKSPSFRMKLFNKLTGNDVLDKLFGQFNKDILRIKRNLKEETERSEERATLLKEKRIQKEKTEAIYTRLKKKVENLKKLYEEYVKLLELKKLRTSNTLGQISIKKSLSVMKFPEDTNIKALRENINQFTQLKELKNTSEKAQAGIEKVRGQLKGFRLPELDIASLKGKIERFSKIESIYEKFSQNRELFSQIQRNSKIAGKDLVEAINEYKALLKEAQVLCPNCKHDITEECLKGIKL